jgi:hypothetical protein
MTIDNDFSRDEVRRELKEIDQAHEAGMKSWRSALHRIFDPSEGIDTTTKAQILGVPGRRQFLKIGGATVLGAAVLAACGSDSNDKSAATTTTTAASSSSSAGTVSDLTLAKTAASLEALAISAYQTAAGSGLVKDQAVLSAATLFMGHHTAHRDALNGVIQAAGAQPITAPNAALDKAILQPALAAAKTQDDVVKLAFTLEDAAAQTYVFATGALSKSDLRSTLMTIAGVEARHRALLGFLVQKQSLDDLFPASFFKADSPLPADALIN